MNVLIFEYATALGLEDPDFLFEGRAMLEGLLDDFNVEGTHYLIAEKFLTPQYNERWEKIKPIILEQDLKQWIDSNISNFDACIFVAAEENMELYELTKKIEEKGVSVLGSSSEAVLTCSDKYKTFNVLKNIVPVIDTHKIFIEDLKKEDIPDKYKFLLKDHKDTSKDSLSEIQQDIFDSSDSNTFKVKMVLKPADGVACQGIKVVESWEDVKEAANNLETSLPYLLLQNFVEGESCSVSLLSTGESAFPLSLNRQKINFTSEGLEYGGGEVPWAHPLAEDAMNVAKLAVENVNGLKGYVGVDIIISGSVNSNHLGSSFVHVVEINSRLTTPYVALRNLTNFNLGQAIVNSCNGLLPDECMLEGSIIFEKSHDKLDISKIN